MTKSVSGSSDLPLIKVDDLSAEVWSGIVSAFVELSPEGV